MRRRTAIAIALVLGLLGTWATAAEPAERAAPKSFEGLLEDLGRPARAEAVRALLAHPSVRRADVAMRVVGRLRHARGPAASDGAVALAAHADPAVRAAALDAAAVLGLRTDATEAVVARLRDREGKVRAAACGALGKMGAAPEIATLLALLEHETERDVVQAAYRALVALTGVRLPYERESWLWWWGEAQARLAARVGRALEALEEDADEVSVAVARRTLARDGWALLPEVRDAAAYWLVLGDTRLRAEGYRLAASLRLGSLADEVERALRFECDPDALVEGRKAAAVLGVAVPGRPADGGRSTAEARARARAETAAPDSD